MNGCRPCFSFPICSMDSCGRGCRANGDARSRKKSAKRSSRKRLKDRTISLLSSRAAKTARDLTKTGRSHKHPNLLPRTEREVALRNQRAASCECEVPLRLRRIGMTRSLRGLIQFRQNLRIAHVGPFADQFERFHFFARLGELANRIGQFVFAAR